MSSNRRVIVMGLTMFGLWTVGAPAVAQARSVNTPLGKFEGGETPAGSFTTLLNEPLENGGHTVAAGGVAVDDSAGANRGDVYVVDTGHDVIDQFTAAGTYNDYQIAAGLSSPTGVAVDSSGNVYVADTGENVVKEFEPSTPTPKLIAKYGEGALSSPTGVAVDSEGNVYVIDAAEEVHKFNAAGESQASLANPTDSVPEALVVDTSATPNELYVIYNEGVFVHYGPSGNVLEEFGPGSISLCPPFSYCSIAYKNAPNVWGVGLQLDGVLYVANDREWDFAGQVEGRLAQVVSFQLQTVPDATTEEPATSVASTRAIVPGKTNPEDTTLTGCEFQYGLETSYGLTAPCKELPAGGSFQPVQAELTGLQPCATYHYQLVVSNANGSSESEGGDRTFKTLCVPPVVHSEYVPAVAREGATLEAKINPSGQETGYSFQYAASPTLAGATTVSGTSTLPGTYNAEGLQATVDVSSLAPNKVYYYRVIAENEQSRTEGNPTEGPIQEFRTSPPLPTAITGGSSTMLADTATLAGSVNPGSTGPNSDTSYYFQYSTSETYAQGAALTDVPAAPGADAGQGTSEVPVSVPVSGLSPQTTYHYRLVAVNDHGEDPAYGEDRQFTTLAFAPQSLGPVLLGETSALLELTLTPEAATTYKLEYGTDGSYGQSVTITPTGDEAEGSELLSLQLSGLAPGTSYHYRLDSTAPSGVNYGPDEAFRTPAPIPPIVEPCGFSLTCLGTAGTAAPVYQNQSLAGVAPNATPEVTPPPTKTPKPKPKALTKAQKLAKALKACRTKRSAHRRAGCESLARKKYGSR
jgi:hypothetical protein